MASIAELKHEWRAFKAERPGHRFVAQHRKSQQHGSRAGRVARAGLGIVLLAAGLVMLVIPGPGLLVSLFGLALLATMSERLARLLDRIEPPLRAAGRAVHDWWKRRALPTKIALASAASVVVVTGAVAMAWRVFA